MSGQLEFGDEDRSASLRRAWELSLHMLVNKVSKVTFETFIRPIQPLDYTESCIRLGVASPYYKDWLEKKAVNPIRSALEFHLDAADLQIEFVVLSREQRSLESSSSAKKSTDGSRAGDAQIALPLDGEEESQPPAAPAPSASARAPRRKTESRPNQRAEEAVSIPSLALNDQYVFENFIIGRSNRLAHAGAMAVATRPGEVYNPLYLYGGPGLGKTHLMQGIAHTLRRVQPNLRVAFVSGEYFAQGFIASIRDHVTEQFRRQYREVDVWLVDDVQFIASKEQTKEEFFHTFNSLYQANRQIVIASDRSPRELNTMDERLRSRFQSGLIADIGAPELETRIAILQQRRERDKIPAPDEVLIYIASAIQSNIRALEGALTKLIAYSSVMNAPISVELAQSVLSEYYIEKPIQHRRVTVNEVIDAVADQFGIAAVAIKGPSRNKDVALARHVAMYLCRELMPEANTMAVGAAFGGRDHATVVHACRRLQSLMDVDTDLKSLTQRLKRTLMSPV